MACGRHDRRALFIPIYLMALASTAGCLHSSFLRPDVEPVLERQSPAEEEPDANERLIVPTSNGTKASQASQAAGTPAQAAPEAALATPLASVPTRPFADPGTPANPLVSNLLTTVPLPPDPHLDVAPNPTIRCSHETQPDVAGQPLQGDVKREGARNGGEGSSVPAQAPSQTPAATTVAPTPAVATAAPTHMPAPEPFDQSPPAASLTPLLDAAIQRVEAVTRQERESSSVTQPPNEPATSKPAPKVASSAGAVLSRPGESGRALPIILDLPGKSGQLSGHAEQKAGLPSKTAPGSRSSADLQGKPGTPERLPGSGAATELAARRDAPKFPSTGRGSTEPAPESDAPDLAARPSGSTKPSGKQIEPLRVANLQLCRKVNGFGSFEPLPGTAIRTGQRILLYCEMTGLRYEPTDSGFASRLSSRVELRAAGSETVLWEQEFGIARDDCRRVRHDYFVSYLLTLPRLLPAGPYRLRVVQTDLAAHQTASSEIDVTIAR